MPKVLTAISESSLEIKGSITMRWISLVDYLPCFFLYTDQKDEIKLKKSYGGEMLNAKNFCLTKYSGNGIFDRTARICMDNHATAMKKGENYIKWVKTKNKNPELDPD